MNSSGLLRYKEYFLLISVAEVGKIKQNVCAWEVTAVNDVTAPRQRVFYWDNLKGFLIFLVVLGHMLEQLVPDGKSLQIYKVIYLFHMPLFVFCSGYLSRFSPKKIFRQLIVPYAALQLFFGLLLFREVQLTTPYWVLWYLAALVVWRVTVPFLDACPVRLRWLVIVGTVAVSCVVGFDNTVGYYATLSRIVVFYPYFVVGYYAKGWNKTEARRPVKIAAGIVLAVLLGGFFFLSTHVDALWLYGTYSYANGGYDILFRLILYVVSAAVGWAMLILTPEKKTFFALWGRCSYAVYLAHPFLLYALMCLTGQAGLDRWILYGISLAASLGVCIAAAGIFKWIKTRKNGRT